MESVLAVDLGGTSLRAARVACTGDVLAVAVRPHSIGIEADAEHWWAMLVDAVAELGTEGVRGICVGGFTRSQILVDAAGHPVRPAQCFPDGRASPIVGAEGGTWMAMTAYHPVARLAWVARHDPDAMPRASCVLQPAEFLAFRLAGRMAGDRIANSWAIDRASGEVTTAPLERAGLPSSLLPPLLAPGSLLGPAREPAGLAGIPVFLGSMDTWVATLGMGLRVAGDAYLVAGTTDAGGVLTAEPSAHPGLVTLPWGDGVFHTGGPSAAGGACLVWAAQLLGLADAAALVALAADSSPRPRLLFLPALMGTRAPHWQPAARGALLGLDASHGRAEIARAILEGIACADRDLLGGLDFTRVMIAGGGASDCACQIRADVLGKPVHRIAGEPGLAGAAMLAWTGLGAYPDIGSAQAAMVKADRVFTPTAGQGYEQLYAAYRSAENVLMILAGTE